MSNKLASPESLLKLGLMLIGGGIIGAIVCGIIALAIRWVWSPFVFFILGKRFPVGAETFYDVDNSTFAIIVAFVLLGIIFHLQQ